MYYLGHKFRGVKIEISDFRIIFYRGGGNEFSYIFVTRLLVESFYKGFLPLGSNEMSSGKVKWTDTEDLNFHFTSP